MRHFASDKIKPVLEASKQLLDPFMRAYTSNEEVLFLAYTKGLKTWKRIQFYVLNWKMEEGIDIMEEE